MSSLLRNKKKQNGGVENTTHERIARSVVVKFLRIQLGWAMFMQRHTERLSHKWKVIMLLIFCLCSGGFSLLFIARSFSGPAAISYKLSQFKTPQHIGKSGDEKTKSIAAVTQAEYEKIQHFKKFMDSLARNPSGKKIYADILNDRPGLMDSIILIENIYHSQIKK